MKNMKTLQFIVSITVEVPIDFNPEDAYLYLDKKIGVENGDVEKFERLIVEYETIDVVTL